jgi:hypothetical protein
MKKAKSKGKKKLNTETRNQETSEENTLTHSWS